MRNAPLLNVALAVAALLLTSCAPAALKAYPDRSADIRSELDRLAIYFRPDTITKYNGEADAAKKRVLRNEIVEGRLRATDIHFADFQEALFKEGVTSNIVIDWITLGLSGAVATVGGAGTKEILGAISGGLIGAKASFDKNAFFDKTMPAILAQMIAQRKSTLIGIREGLARGVEEYSLEQALSELDNYYQAGTIPGAILAVTEQAGASAKNSDAILLNLRSKPFFEKQRQDRVQAIIEKIKKLDDQSAIKLAGNPPVQLSTSESAMIRRVDPGDQRLKDGKAARQALTMMATLGERTDKDLDAWEAVLKSVE